MMCLFFLLNLKKKTMINLVIFKNQYKMQFIKDLILNRKLQSAVLIDVFKSPMIIFQSFFWMQPVCLRLREKK